METPYSKLFETEQHCRFRGPYIYYFPKVYENEEFSADLNDSDFKFIEDLQKYIDDNKLYILKFRKVIPVKATRGKNQYVITYDSEDRYETTCFASENDWVLYNIGKPGNKWVISDEMFKWKYKQIDDNIYEPIFTVEVCQLPENIKYKKGNQILYFLKDGYLIKDSTTGKIHGCAQKDFEYSYDIVKE